MLPKTTGLQDSELEVYEPIQMSERDSDDREHSHSHGHSHGHGHLEVSDKSMKGCIFSLLQLSFPLASSFFMDQFGNFVTLVLAGKFSEDIETATTIFASIALCTTIYNITFFSIIYGVASALETLASRANGLRDYQKVSAIFTKSVIITFVLILPFTPIVFCTKQILKAMGIEFKVAKLTAKYLLVRATSIPADIFSNDYNAYLTAMGVGQPTFWGAIVENGLIVLFDYLSLLFKLDESFLIWSISAANYLSTFFCYLLSLRYQEVQRTKMSREDSLFQDWKPILYLGIPGILQIASQWWAYQILMLMAGKLGKDLLAAFGIVIQLTTIISMVPYSIGLSACSYVGNSMGEANVKMAKKFSEAAFLLVSAITIIIAIFIFTFKHHLILLYTKSPSVYDIISAVTPLLAAYIFIDGLQVAANGVLRGYGRQNFGAFFNVIGFFIIGLPVAYLCCFTKANLGLLGLLSAMTCGDLIQVLVLIPILFCCNSWIYLEVPSLDANSVNTM